MPQTPAGATLGRLGRLTLKGARRVPEVTAFFWAIKALSTAMGESTSDYLVHAMAPELAVVLGFIGFGVFGTMAADVLHVGFGVPYAASSVLYGVVLLVVFVSWQRTEKTLSIHSIDTDRRELFYWAAVVATFAMGTAVGDLTAVTFGLGYLASGLLFAAVIAVPAIGYWRLGWNPILCFWIAYVATRPLGASFADWMGKPQAAGGLGWGDGTVALILTGAIIGLVAYLTVTRRDVQPAGAPAYGAAQL